MLEEKLKGVKRKIAIGVLAAGVFIASYACAGVRVPVGTVSSNGTVSSANHGPTCCQKAACQSKGYDGCRNDEPDIEDGVLYANCHCYSNYHASGRTTSTSEPPGVRDPIDRHPRERGHCERPNHDQ